MFVSAADRLGNHYARVRLHGSILATNSVCGFGESDLKYEVSTGVMTYTREKLDPSLYGITIWKVGCTSLYRVKCLFNDWFDGRVIGNELEDEDCSAKENMQPFDYLSTLVAVRGRQLLCYLGHS